jgi:hypothetical protein
MPKMPCAFVNRGADARTRAFHVDMGERGGKVKAVGLGVGVGGRGCEDSVAACKSSSLF